MAQKSIGTIATEIVDLLTPLSSEERGRVLTAALALLGEATPIRTTAQPPNDSFAGHESLPLSNKGKLWSKQNQITSAQLSEIFHFDNGGAEIILGEIVGASTREKVRNAYILLGLSNYLASDTPTIDDKAARELCERFGIYDHSNHSKAFKGGNELTGSFKNGWTVTAPGLKHAAALVKQSSNSDD